ncbi:MAG: flagellar basal body-associated FliL family protein [Deltaproteobacteria bacterium]|nr:flagellar basal body-associated FliL family protein [Deltaproteobacteria bacterium]
MAEQAETPVAGAGGGNKGIPVKVIVAIFGLLLLLGGVGLVLKSGVIGQLGVGGEETRGAEAKKGAASDMGPIYSLETFVVNLADERGKKYLKTRLELELDGDMVVTEIDQRLPQFRDTILTILSSKSFEDVRQLEGKYQLRAEIMTMLNQFLNSGKITNIYFTEFIVQ